MRTRPRTFGPRFVLSTSCRPFAALMFMNSAASFPSDSAFGFSVLTDILPAPHSSSQLFLSSHGDGNDDDDGGGTEEEELFPAVAPAAFFERGSE